MSTTGKVAPHETLLKRRLNVTAPNAMVVKIQELAEAEVGYDLSVCAPLRDQVDRGDELIIALDVELEFGVDDLFINRKTTIERLAEEVVGKLT